MNDDIHECMHMARHDEVYSQQGLELATTISLCFVRNEKKSSTRESQTITQVVGLFNIHCANAARYQMRAIEYILPPVW
jgi:hypothetical protein